MDKRADGSVPRNPGVEFALGGATCCVVLLTVGFVSFALYLGAYLLDYRLGVLVEAVMTFYVLAGKCLRVECMKVYDALQTRSLDDARQTVAMIVGRDVQSLDRAAVTRAAVETAAENASDGVIAPLFYACLGGPALAMIYKAVNTMDSMIGYRNARYERFGTCAARLDDLVNFIPSRLCAALMILAAAALGKNFSAKNAIRIFRRDRFNHKSPNSAQTESVCAGALGLRLAGNAYYFGKLVEKPFIGDRVRQIEPEDIPRSLALVDGAVYAGFALACAVIYCASRILPL